MDTFKRKSSKSRNPSPGTTDDKLLCEIILLDPTQTNYLVNVNSHDNGSILFDNVCKHMGGILEKDYFGLRYLDKHGQRQWLEMDKSILKQVKDKNHQKSTQMFSFRFKHYPKNPCDDLKQDLSRYLLYLQLRRDLYRGRLVGQSNEQYNMAALILQAETGDFDIADIENSVKIADLKILPHMNRKSEAKILEIHEKLKELDSKIAEKQFLEEASKLETYGVEPIPVKDQKGNELFVGIVDEGISTFNGSKRAHTFPWHNILKLSYSHKMFMFQVYMDQRKHILGFKCESTFAACALWKWAIDRKCFFTLDKGSQARRSRSGGSIFRKKKTHTFVGMSQKELTQSCENLQIIPQPHVARAQSMMTLMRSISSRNESSIFNGTSLANGIDSSDKGYSTLPRSHGMKSLYAENNDESDSKKKSKSPSAAVGAVLDFMQALKETPILHRSVSNNCYQPLPNEEDEVIQPDPADKDDTDSVVVTEMIDIANAQRDSLSFSELAFESLSKSVRVENGNVISASTSNSRPFYYPIPLVIICIIMLIMTIVYSLGLLSHIHSSDPSSPAEPASIVGWMTNTIRNLIFKDVGTD